MEPENAAAREAAEYFFAQNPRVAAAVFIPPETSAEAPSNE
jgi:hypothetical protein